MRCDSLPLEVRGFLATLNLRSRLSGHQSCMSRCQASFPLVQSSGQRVGMRPGRGTVQPRKPHCLSGWTLTYMILHVGRLKQRSWFVDVCELEQWREGAIAEGAAKNSQQGAAASRRAPMRSLPCCLRSSAVCNRNMVWPQAQLSLSAGQ